MIKKQKEKGGKRKGKRKKKGGRTKQIKCMLF
jgi:hypothetical protein